MPMDTVTPSQTPHNRLLASLAPEAYRRLAPRMERVTTNIRQVIYEQDGPITQVYFPIAGVYSMVKLTPEGAPIEVATIGKEGFVGVPVVLGAALSTELVICQVAGAAARIGLDEFQDALQTDPDLHRALLRYTHALITMIAQASACNRLHDVEERAARWLLMTHDRVDGDEFGLTQEFLATMLGVRRQAVNVAAGVLARAGLISYTRGNVRILDRPGLEAASCECYDAIRGNFTRLLGERTTA